MNIREIARIADVTPGTVSKVMNNYPDVGEATRKHDGASRKEKLFQRSAW